VWGVEVQLHSFKNSTLETCESSASRFSRLHQRRRSRGGSRTVLYDLNRGAVFFLCWKSNHDSAIWQYVAYSLHRLCCCVSVGGETEGIWYPHRGRTTARAVMLFDLHSDINRFESKLEYRLSWQISSWIFSVPFEKCWENTLVGHGHFLPHPFPFIIWPVSYRVILQYSVNFDSVVE
jgi:hypothetical protein